jgi:hypothetical protein
VNLSASTEEGKVRFDFNNHFEIKTLVEFKERISQMSIAFLLKDAETMLSAVYLKK